MDHKDILILLLTGFCIVESVIAFHWGWCNGAASVYREWIDENIENNTYYDTVPKDESRNQND